MDSQALETVFGFTREEWFRAYSFDEPDAEALANVNTLFARHKHGSEGFVFPHYDLLRLSYVSDECRAKVLSQIGADQPANWLLEKLRLMDRDMRSGGQLRRWPATGPL